jgi:hypothetical protein
MCFRQEALVVAYGCFRQEALVVAVRTFFDLRRDAPLRKTPVGFEPSAYRERSRLRFVSSLDRSATTARSKQ